MTAFPIAFPSTFGDETVDEGVTLPTIFPFVFGDETVDEGLTLPFTLPDVLGVPLPEDPWKPYRPPATPQRGWRVGPIAYEMDAAAGDCTCLDAELRVDTETITMAAASGASDCLAGTVAITTWVDSNISMLLAGSSGDGLSASSSVDSSTIMLPADSGGTALAPALSVSNPVTFSALGTGDSDTNNSGGITLSWTHTASATDSIVVVPLCLQTHSHYGDHGHTVTYSGTAMTSMGIAWTSYDSSTNLYMWVSWFYLLSPPAGTSTVVATVDSTGDVVIGGANSLSYKGANTVGPVLYTQGGPGGPTSHTMSSATNHMIVCAASAYGNFVGGNQTVRDIGTYYHIQDAPGATSVTFTSGFPGSSRWVSAAIDLSS